MVKKCSEKTEGRPQAVSRSETVKKYYFLTKEFAA